MAAISVENLNRDISSLIEVSKADFGVTPWDSSIQTRLKALLDLQTILQSQQLPQEQLALIRDQVAQLSQASKASTRTQASPPAPITPAPVAVAPVNDQAATLNSLLGSGALAALLARQSATPQPVQATVAPPIRSPQITHSAPYVPTPAPAPAATQAQDASALLERLRAAGIIGGTPVTKSPALANSQLPVPVIPGFPPPPPKLHSTPPVNRAALAEIPNDVVLKPASLKM